MPPTEDRDDRTTSTPPFCNIFTWSMRIDAVSVLAACSVKAVRRNESAKSSEFEALLFTAAQSFSAGALTFSMLSSLFKVAASGSGPTELPRRQRTQHDTGSTIASRSPLLKDLPAIASLWRHGARATPMRLVASSVKRKMVSLIAGFEKRPITLLIHSFLSKPCTSLHVLAAAPMYCSKNLDTRLSAIES